MVTFSGLKKISHFIFFQVKYITGKNFVKNIIFFNFFHTIYRKCVTMCLILCGNYVNFTETMRYLFKKQTIFAFCHRKEQLHT